MHTLNLKAKHVITLILFLVVIGILIGVFFPNLDWTVFDWTVGVAALVIILTDRMWKELPSDHPAVYQEPVLDG
jgi:hypothetical protein